MIKKILLLGGSGYLGGCISARFKKEKNFTVTIGDIMDPGKKETDFIFCNVMDQASVESAVSKSDIVIICIGQITNPINVCLRLNSEGINNIVKIIGKTSKKVFHISTVAVYGTTNYADEKSDLNPESVYAAAKAFAEFQINNILHEDQVCILRLPNLYGDNQSKGLFAYIKKAFHSDHILDFNNDGTLTRYFLHISDCADAIFLAIANDLHGIFNVTCIDKLMLKDVITEVEKAGSIVFKKSFKNILPPENIDVLDCNSFINASGFRPKISLADFITKNFSKYA